MGSYVPATSAETKEMLSAIGVNCIEDLFQNVPKDMFVKKLNIPEGMSELEVRAAVTELAEKNHVFKTILRGAGAYNHFIPAIVKSVISKEEFLTAYTPYQAEISQGVLQSIFEYQTMICKLTGMDVSNASVYDGNTAAAEAVTMCRDRKHTKAYISATCHPHTIETVKTYCFGSDVELAVIPAKDGKTDLEAMKSMLGADAACVILQQPNYFGLMENAEEAGRIVHEAGAKFVMSVNPIACALMKTPFECGADVAVGEGQPLGMPIAFGGPYLGFMACVKDMARKLPGRIVGQTTDVDGNRGYVLTLTAREQHIRREKASSNICSNEALCALTAAVYMTAMGDEGMTQCARLCMSKAHYLASELCRETGCRMAYEGEYFHEFVTSFASREDALKVLEALKQNDILGGLLLDGGDVLWCVTEVVTRQQLDKAVCIAKEALK